MSKEIKPKEYIIPSRNWGITADEAAETLLTYQEIKDNKPLHKAALAVLKDKQKAISKMI